MTSLRDLLERVERATGPDRAIDRAIWYAIVQDNPPAGEKDPTHAALYTSSVDAALALIGRDSSVVEWRLHVSPLAHELSATAILHSHIWVQVKTAPTPALALCAALLAAKIEQEGSQ